jgi:hypothetical protein
MHAACLQPLKATRPPTARAVPVVPARSRRPRAVARSGGRSLRYADDEEAVTAVRERIAVSRGHITKWRERTTAMLRWSHRSTAVPADEPQVPSLD